MPGPDETPQVTEACWDRSRVAQLFDDLSSGAVVRYVQVRGATSPETGGTARVSLEQARRMVDDSAVQALQIYYEYDGQSWCDTLIPKADQVRIIRAPLPRDE